MPTQTKIPTLTSDRIVIRGHGEADLDAALSMWAHEEVVRHIGGRAFTREEVWHRILRYLGHWELRPYGYWVVEERASGRFIGEIGFADWKRARLADYEGVPECGWALHPSAHGKGYASEALAMVLEWSDAAGLGPTICIISEGNAPSIRLANKNGYGEIRRHDDDTALYLRQPTTT